ncbi:hypothetical protein [Romboutsia sp.]|uniref:DUF7841 family protein n=1 Tax=Romboutsia sp. TaxID=1965302 RepID=UPI002C843B36|nr:hypothetical protein [Romboutsia sp.]HSQ89380.1 hypothetical protein [Romboutsia sp.]
MGKMTIYDITKDNYAKAKGDDNKMWNSTKLLSDTICTNCNMSENDYWRLLKKYYSIMAGEHFNKEFAEWQISQMFYIDKNGKRHDSPYWSMAQKIEVYKTIKPRLKYDYNEYDFAVTLEMIQSDNHCLYADWFPNATESEMTDKYIQSAITWLNDDDYPNGGKIWRYFNS